jgi:hypothetical protein
VNTAAKKAETSNVRGCLRMTHLSFCGRACTLITGSGAAAAV